MAKVIKTIEDLFDRAGGPVQIAARLCMSEIVVYKWKSIGVPQKHWHALMAWLGVDLVKLHNITQKARENNKNK